MESPFVVSHIIECMQEIGNAANAFGLPVVTKITRPAADQSFWVNLIGRGYPSPNQNFRWCTDRMKIAPTNRYIMSQVDKGGKVILLLGVRRSETKKRAAMVSKYDNGKRLHKHSVLKGCSVFRPIVELATEDVWEFLALNDPPPLGRFTPQAHRTISRCERRRVPGCNVQRRCSVMRNDILPFWLLDLHGSKKGSQLGRFCQVRLC